MANQLSIAEFVLVVKYRHEKIRKFRGSDAVLAKRLTKVMQDFDYRNHWYRAASKQEVELFPHYNRWAKTGF